MREGSEGERKEGRQGGTEGGREVEGIVSGWVTSVGTVMLWCVWV